MGEKTSMIDGDGDDVYNIVKQEWRFDTMRSNDLLTFWFDRR